jgi:hypothetical protein
MFSGPCEPVGLVGDHLGGTESPSLGAWTWLENPANERGPANDPLMIVTDSIDEKHFPEDVVGLSGIAAAIVGTIGPRSSESSGMLVSVARDDGLEDDSLELGQLGVWELSSAACSVSILVIPKLDFGSYSSGSVINRPAGSPIPVPIEADVIPWLWIGDVLVVLPDSSSFINSDSSSTGIIAEVSSGAGAFASTDFLRFDLIGVSIESIMIRLVSRVLVFCRLVSPILVFCRFTARRMIASIVTAGESIKSLSLSYADSSISPIWFSSL